MSSSEKDMCHHTNTSTSEEVNRPHERDITFMPTKPCHEVKRTKLVFLYSDEDEDIRKQNEVNDINNICKNNTNSSNKTNTQESIRELQEELEEELPHSNKKAECTSANFNVKEVSTSSLLLHADLSELQEDAQHIKKRACENENINSDACTSKMNDFPFYEDVALPQDLKVTEDLIHGHTMHVKEVEVETLPYAVRQRYTIDRHHYNNNNTNNLRTHFTIEEFANTHIDCKRLRENDISCENNNKNEEQESENEKSENVDMDVCMDNNENEVHRLTTSSNNAHVDATLVVDKNEDKHRIDIVVIDSKEDNNTVFDNTNDDNDEDDDSDEVVQVHCIKPIISDDGKVHVVESNGYCLTVNEEDLLDLNSESHYNHAISGEVDKTSIDKEEEDNNNNVVICHGRINIINDVTESNSEEIGEHDNEDSEEQSHNADDTKEEKVEVEQEEEVMEDEQYVKEVVEENGYAWEQEDEGDYYDEDEDEEESDEELDQCLLVAIVDRLVECCESPELDSNLSIEAARFCAVAKPLLTQLRNDEITYATFDKNIHKQLNRFMRVYKSVYRPRDAPIIINGVQMDL